MGVKSAKSEQRFRSVRIISRDFYREQNVTHYNALLGTFVIRSADFSFFFFFFSFSLSFSICAALLYNTNASFYSCITY